MSKANAIVATSPNYFATSPILKKYADKVRVVPIGLDENSYPAVSQDRADFFRNIVGSDFFLFVGVLRYYKGLQILLDAAKDSGLPVVIVGSGPTEKELRDRVHRENISNVSFFGYLPDEDKVALLSLCKAIVFPSHMRAEAFGVSLLEGAMFRKPLISCDIGTGCSYINIDGETGIVTEPHNPWALRKAMLWMQNHPERCREMGEKARKRFEQLFTADIMAQQYIELYTDILKGNQQT
jgi:rhamnosyl/mannosyltransferase